MLKFNLITLFDTLYKSYNYLKIIYLFFFKQFLKRNIKKIMFLCLQHLTKAMMF